MNMKKFSAAVVLLFTFTGLTLLSLNCYNEDDARVTIHLERNDLAATGIQPGSELSVIDRILNFFSTPAEATSVPQWNDDRTDLKFTVMNGKTTVMTATIPANATSYTTFIPAGYNATIIITAKTDWLNPVGNIHNCWGGQTVTELKPGEDIEITIQMIPMTYISDVNLGTSTIDIFWQTYQITSVKAVSGYRIYKSTEIDGDYSYLTQTTGSGFGEAYNPSNPPSSKYYYRVSCLVGSVEGVMCDPVTW